MRLEHWGLTFDDFRSVGQDIHILSHFHSDHMMGLDERFSGPLYCSTITGRLLKRFRRVSESSLFAIDPGHEIEIKPGVRIKAFDANHCPGALMFLLRDERENILFTGDFRYCAAHDRHPELFERISTLFVDQTFGSSEDRYEHPTQDEAIGRVLDVIRANPDKQVFIGMYRIGKEKILQAIHRELGLKTLVSTERWQFLEELGMQDCATIDARSTRIRAMAMGYLEKHFERDYPDHVAKIVVIFPTGWAADNVDGGGYYYVPYSEHNSSSELRRFIGKVGAQRVLSIHDQSSVDSCVTAS